MPDLNCIFFTRKNIVHHFGYFRKTPPPLSLCLVYLFSWKYQTFLPNVFHDWSIFHGTSDKFYPPSSDRTFLAKKIQNSLFVVNLKKLGKQQKWWLRLTSIASFSLERTLCINLGIFEKIPLPMCLLCVFFVEMTNIFTQGFP